MTITPVLPRPQTLHNDLKTLVHECPVDELVDRLYELYLAHSQPIADRSTMFEAEATRAADDARRSHHMLGQVHALASHQINSLATHTATIAHQNVLLRQVRKLAQGAFEGKVSADDVMAVLATEVAEPLFQPVALNFYPSTQYRGGQFATQDGRIRSTFAFIGWSTVAINPVGGVQTQPTFLVQDRGALPAGVIEVERQMTLQLPLLPNVQAV